MNAPSPLPFLVVCSAKCGCDELFRALTEAAVNTTVERIFSNHGEEYAARKRLEHPTSMCEISWMAVPFIRSSPLLANTCVIRLMRHPFALLYSLARNSPLFRDDDRLGDRPCASLFIEKHLPRVFQQATPEERAAEYIVGWDALMVREYACRGILTHRIEDDPNGLLSRMRGVQRGKRWMANFPAIEIGEATWRPLPPGMIDPAAAGLSRRHLDSLSELAYAWGYD